MKIALSWLSIEMKRCQSNAQWPLEFYRGIGGDGVSTDVHPNETMAESVCKSLEKEGVEDGKGNIIFPIKTWISEVD